MRDQRFRELIDAGADGQLIRTNDAQVEAQIELVDGGRMKVVNANTILLGQVVYPLPDLTSFDAVATVDQVLGSLLNPIQVGSHSRPFQWRSRILELCPQRAVLDPQRENTIGSTIVNTQMIYSLMYW